MNRLIDFPLVALAFQRILDDDHPPGWMNPQIHFDRRVPDSWLVRFKLAQSGLERTWQRKISSLNLRVKRMCKSYDIKDSESCFDWVVVPMDDLDHAILKSVGATRGEIAAIKDVLNEYFDGSLNEVFFTMDRPSSRKAQKRRKAARK